MAGAGEGGGTCAAPGVPSTTRAHAADAANQGLFNLSPPQDPGAANDQRRSSLTRYARRSKAWRGIEKLSRIPLRARYRHAAHRRPRSGRLIGSRSRADLPEGRDGGLAAAHLADVPFFSQRMRSRKPSLDVDEKSCWVQGFAGWIRPAACALLGYGERIKRHPHPSPEWTGQERKPLTHPPER